MKLDFKKLPLVFTVSAVLFTILFLMVVGISFWILIFGIIWLLFYLIFISQKITLSFIKHEAAWIFLGLLLVVSLIFIFVVNGGSTSNKTSEKKLSPEECAPIYEKYNEKVLKISSDGLQGSIGVTIDKETCEADVNYNFLFKANIPRNWTVADVAEWTKYEYSAGLIRPGEKRKYSDGQSMVSPVYFNKTTLVTNPFDFGLGNETVNSYNPDQEEYKDTDTFYVGWANSYIFSEEKWNKLKEYTKLEVVDASPYVTTAEEDDGVKSYSTDYSKAFQEGSVVASFDLTISE